MAEARAIEDDEALTQCGSYAPSQDVFSFRTAPRIERDPPEQEVSLTLGALRPTEAHIRVFGQCQPRRAASRVTTAGALHVAGFHVVHTPRRLSPEHVSVFCLGDWDNVAQAAFNSCFEEARRNVDE